ncbi:hypothetical protein B296_00003676 [Ensete ventricosum]|uniref:Uncharacterized protein n=1 Tax=Ensete ventricosum TaxID=4639 RepID=A0A426ZTR5_ENSVE|nr:hypothetical protein B296_00003676 [Ensete ventricosum]
MCASVSTLILAGKSWYPVGRIALWVWLGCRSFYTVHQRSFVPDTFNALVVYHTAIRLHVILGPGSVVHVALTAVAMGRPYLHHVDRTSTEYAMPVLGRLSCVRLAVHVLGRLYLVSNCTKVRGRGDQSKSFSRLLVKPLRIRQLRNWIGREDSSRTGLAEHDSSRTGLAEQGSSGTGLAEQGSSKTGLAERGGSRAGLAEQDSSRVGMVEQGSSDTGLVKRTAREPD